MSRHIAVSKLNEEKVILTENCIFNMKAMRVEVSGEEFESKSLGNALKVLKYLVENNGWVRNKDNIISGIWENDIDPGPTDINNLLTIIYRMVGKPGPLENIRNLGYCLNLPDQPVVERHEKTDDSDEFISDIFKRSKVLINEWEEKQDYEIDPDLLAGCTVRDEEYSNLYEYVSKLVNGESHRNCIVQAMGGSGKTSSLVYTCKQFMDNAESVIPVFVQMRKLDETLENPIQSYIYNNYVQEISFSKPHELEHQFFKNLGIYLKKSNKFMLIVLDGCNETSKKALSDLNKLIDIPNTIVIASTRLIDEKMNEFISVKLHTLDRNTACQYLNKYKVSLDRDLDNENLRLPIFIYMMAQICKDKVDSQQKLARLISQASIINEWINNDLKEDNKINIVSNEEARFTIECFLPLLAMTLFFNSSAQEHSSLRVSKEKYQTAIKDVLTILKDDDFLLSIEIQNGWNVVGFNLNKCLSDKVIERFAFLQRGNNKDYLFCWSHECYRDWFIAKGMNLLRNHSDKLSYAYMDRFIDGPFNYPDAFNDNDFSAYSVAVFYAELVGEECLSEINDIRYHQLIRNIAYYADDVGNVRNVLDYTDYILKRNSNSKIETPLYQKAHALSGMAYTLLHIYNLKNREDRDAITEKSFLMLLEAKNALIELVGISFDSCDITSDELVELTPQQLAAYYDRQLKSEHFCYIEDLCDKNDLEYNLYDTLALYARLYGNLGSYYINKFDIEKDIAYLKEAYKVHVIGGLIKQFLLIKEPNEILSGNTTGAAMALTYRSLGIDLYRLNRNDNSVAYLEYSKKQFENSEKDDILLDSYIIKSKIACILEQGSEQSIEVLIREEKEVVEKLKNKRMIGALERIVDVIADMIVICKVGNQSSETKESLEELIYFVDTVFDEFAIEDGLSNSLFDFWNKNDKAQWSKYCD